MQYLKRAISLEEQADLLLGRGLIADKKTLIFRLKSVNYYRLSGYWYPFKNDDDSFKDNTTLDIVWQRYRFDRQLRIHIMDAIERIEVAIRSQLTNIFTLKYGSFGYLEIKNLPNISEKEYNKFIDLLKQEAKRSREKFITHFLSKYGDNHEYFPLWMAVELIPFGMTLTLFRAVNDDIKKKIASFYNIPDSVMESWLVTLNMIRNICAHHGRLWNRELGCKPMIPRENKHPEWHNPASPSSNRVFIVVLILKYMMNYIAPQSGWAERIKHLLDEFPEIPIDVMGFPKNWGNYIIWNHRN